MNDPSAATSRRHATVRVRTVATRLLLATLLLAVLGVACSTTAPPAAVPGSSDRGDYLILISLDGFRWDFVEMADTPHLDSLIARGVRAERLIPSFPSKTFPNHYTIVTGLYPEHHGIVANNIFDPVFDARFSLSNRQEVQSARWWLGEPIWVTAEKQGLRTAPLFWPGSEAPIGGRRPTHWRPFDHDLPKRERVDLALGWLALSESERPSFLTLYFSDLDDAAHAFGTEPSPRLRRAIRAVDEAIGHLLDGLERAGILNRVNLLVVSDHGMASTSRERVILVDDYVDLEQANLVDWSPVLGAWPRDEHLETVYRGLHGAHPHLTVYRREEIPARLHYNSSRRIPPIVAIADDGWSIGTRIRWEQRPESFDGGSHGYDPELSSMGALLIAAGPTFRSGIEIPPVRNIHLYELMCEILDLEPAANDGSLEATREMLRPRSDG